MKCPQCGLINPEGAMRCDCGWDFETGALKRSYTEEAENSLIVNEKPASSGFLGTLLFCLGRLIRGSALGERIGCRWSLYVLRGKSGLCFAQHSDNVHFLCGFAWGLVKRAQPPFSVVLNFNLTNEVVRLQPCDFNAIGDLSESKVLDLYKIDPECGRGKAAGTDFVIPGGGEDLTFAQVMRFLGTDGSENGEV